MLPIVDYGSIAIVVPKIAAVGGVVKDEKKFGFEVFLEGTREPIIVRFDTEKEAEESRNELVAIIAQYHYTVEMGPDFDIEELMENLDEEEFDEEEDEDKKEH